MTSQEAFKFGFLMQCAQEGLSEEATHARLAKAAALVKVAAASGKSIFVKNAEIPIIGPIIRGGAGLAAAGIKAVAPFALNASLLALLAGPPLVGAGLGATAAKLQESTYDKDEAKTDEEIAEYARAIDQLKRSRRQRTLA